MSELRRRRDRPVDAPDAGAPAAADAAADAPPPEMAARIEAPSTDIAPAGDAPGLPGAHRGGFLRPMTEPLPVTEPVRIDVTLAPEASRPLPRSAAWALAFAIAGLIVAFFVGWGVPIGLLAAGLAIVALRRPWEARGVAVWALCLSLLSVLFSAGWIWWSVTQGALAT